jgi:hypothetical protein
MSSRRCTMSRQPALPRVALCRSSRTCDGRSFSACRLRRWRYRQDCAYSILGRRAFAPAAAVQNCSLQFCRTCDGRSFWSCRLRVGGAPGRTRTCDPRLRRPMLYPTELRAPLPILHQVVLPSPGRIAPLPSMAGARSRQRSLSKIVPYDFVEPATLGLEGRCSIQLSYGRSEPKPSCRTGGKRKVKGGRSENCCRNSASEPSASLVASLANRPAGRQERGMRKVKGQKARRNAASDFPLSSFLLPLLISSMVGAEGFEPPTLCSQSRCATRLRHAPPEPSSPGRRARVRTSTPHGTANDTSRVRGRQSSRR